MSAYDLLVLLLFICWLVGTVRCQLKVPRRCTHQRSQRSSTCVCVCNEYVSTVLAIDCRGSPAYSSTIRLKRDRSIAPRCIAFAMHHRVATAKRLAHTPKQKQKTETERCTALAPNTHGRSTACMPITFRQIIKSNFQNSTKQQASQPVSRERKKEMGCEIVISICASRQSYAKNARVKLNPTCVSFNSTRI